MTPRELLDSLDEIVTIADGFDEALMGYVERRGMAPRALYDRDKCIQILIDRDKMSDEDAEEFFDFNVIGSWMGEMTPFFATLGQQPQKDF